MSTLISTATATGECIATVAFTSTWPAAPLPTGPEPRICRGCEREYWGRGKVCERCKPPRFGVKLRSYRR